MTIILTLLRIILMNLFLLILDGICSELIQFLCSVFPFYLFFFGSNISCHLTESFLIYESTIEFALRYVSFENVRINW